LIINRVYDYKTELIFGIDQKIQEDRWDQALKLSSRYPENDLLILYFTNLALYKTGQLGERLFHYDQVGPSGLFLEWKSSDVINMYGSEIFYQLGYMNEAYRWTFGAMVINGPSPRLLKKLILTSIINKRYAAAQKYLNLLNQSMFYRKWANHYQKYVTNPDLTAQDEEITVKRQFLIHNDFFAGEDNTYLGLTKLLENHPDNKMAFEYYMVSLLLDKDVIAFAENIEHIKNFDYKEIPVHFEEAMLWYMGYSKKNIIPEGFVIRQSTIQRFKEYAGAYNSNFGNPDQMARNLQKSFGTTFWFYYHFNNPQISKR
jgi:hypothetical protein